MVISKLLLIFVVNMENTEINEAISKFLKENLTVEISTRKEIEYNSTFTAITVSLFLNGEKIYESTDSL